MLRKVITYITYPVLIAVMVLCLVAVAQAATGNVDAVDKWAWGTNVGWINFNPIHGGVTVYDDHLEGYAWGENIGWIHFKGTGAVAYGVIVNHTLTIDTTGIGEGTGRVTSEPAGINCGEDCTGDYDQGTVVTLRAHPGVRSYFIKWSGDCVSTGSLSAQVTMDADSTCTATFGYPVGGIVVPVDKLGLVAPWLGLKLIQPTLVPQA